MIKAMQDASPEPCLALLKDMEELMPDPREWGWPIVNLWFGDHLDYKGRCKLVWWSAANGVAPATLVNWCIAKGPGYLRHKKSCLHLANLLRSWQRGDFEGQNGKEPKEAWSTWAAMKVTVPTPTFAHETIGRAALDHKAGASFWYDAIRDLERLAAARPR